MTCKRLTQTLAALLCVLPATAAMAKQHEVEAKGVEELRLEVFSADVRLIAWDEKRVRIRARGDHPQRIQVKQRGSVLDVTVDVGDHDDWHGDDDDDDGDDGHHRHMRHLSSESSAIDDIDVWVPRSIAVDAASFSGDLELEGTSGEVEVGSTSGDVDARGVKGEVQLTSVSGDVRLRQGAGKFQVRTVSGDIRLEALEGKIKAHSVSGDIEIGGSKISSLKVRSVSGDMVLYTQMQKNGHYDFQSTSGDVELHVPKGSAFHYELESATGSIEGKPFGVRSSRGEAEGSTANAKADDPSLSAQSFSGSIRLSPLDPHDAKKMGVSK
jgi:hypothetical protein